MGLVERLSRSHLHWNVPPVSGASVFCGVSLPDCAAASLHRVVNQVHVVFCLVAI